MWIIFVYMDILWNLIFLKKNLHLENISIGM
jgi:hypothetical protein